MCASGRVPRSSGGTPLVASTECARAPELRRSLRVVVVWPPGVWRRGCSTVLEAEPEIEIVQVDDLEGLAGLELDHVDVVIAGVTSTAVDDGTRVVRELADTGYSVLAVVGSHVPHPLVLGAGACRCISSPALDEVELVEGVRAVARGERCDPGTVPDVAALSPRERQVLASLAAGSTDKEIANALGISVRTVQSHLDRIRGKTQRNRRAQLTALAFELGIGPRREHI